jgi:TM2 domain-containing membrane protein YozV
MITCPACNTQNPDDGKFCIGCGIDLRESATMEKVLTDSVEAPAEPPAPPRDDVPPEYLAATVVSATPVTPPPTPQPPPAPEPAIISQPAQSYTTPPSSTPYEAAPTKDRTLALVLELIPAFFGFFGIGWMYGGNMTVGLIALIGVIVWNVIGLVIAFFTAGFSLCCTVPLNMAFMAVSGYFLYDYTNKHPETFGP